jgi:predicted flap endonuclease-1-like 5' DNA nuclease
MSESEQVEDMSNGESWYEDIEELLTDKERQPLGMQLATVTSEIAKIEAEKSIAVRGFKDRLDSLEGTQRELSRGMLTGVMKRVRPMVKIFDQFRQLVYHVVADSNPPIITHVRNMDDLEMERDHGGEVDGAIVEAATAWLGKHRAPIKSMMAENAREAEKKRGPGRPPKVVAAGPKPAAGSKKEAAPKFDVTAVKGISPKVKADLLKAGLRTAGDILDAGEEGLASVKGMGKIRAFNLIAYCREWAPGHVAATPAAVARLEASPLAKPAKAGKKKAINLDEIFAADGDDEGEGAAADALNSAIGDDEAAEGAIELDVEDAQYDPDED